MSQQEKLGGMLIFSVCFIGFFIAVVTMGNDFFANSERYRQYSTQELDAGSTDFIGWNFSETFVNLTYGSGTQVLDFNPHINVKLLLWWGGNVYTPPQFSCAHVHHEVWGWNYDFQAMSFEIKDYAQLSKPDVVNRFEKNVSQFYPVFCNDLTITLEINDYNHTRNDISSAWDDGKMDITGKFGLDDYKAKLTAWDIVGRLLTFQGLEIIGLSGDIATILSFIITLPLYTCIAYLIYRIILLALPFVGG